MIESISAIIRLRSTRALGFNGNLLPELMRSTGQLRFAPVQPVRCLG